MGAGEVVQLAGQFGPMGLMIAYLMWREVRTEKLSRDRIDADKELAQSLVNLAFKIDGMRA